MSATIFLSYSQRDREQAAAVAAALERAGYTIWWDRNLQPGDEFPAEIEAQVRSAACVVVLWTEASVASRWVRAEATIGLNRGVLVPLLFNGAEPPLEFINIHAVDISDWLRGGDNQTEQTLLSAIARRTLPQAPSATTAPPDRVAELQRHLLSGPNRRELKAAAYELEAILSTQPSHVRARMLLDDYRVALERERMWQSDDHLVVHYRLAPLSVWRSLGSIALYFVSAMSIGHLVFDLGLLGSAIAAIGLPIAVWAIFVILAGVINLWEWVRRLLGKGDREA